MVYCPLGDGLFAGGFFWFEVRGLWELVFLEVLLGWELWRTWGAGLLGAAQVGFLRFTVDCSSRVLNVNRSLYGSTSRVERSE